MIVTIIVIDRATQVSVKAICTTTLEQARIIADRYVKLGYETKFCITNINRPKRKKSRHRPHPTNIYEYANRLIDSLDVLLNDLKGGE